MDLCTSATEGAVLHSLVVLCGSTQATPGQIVAAPASELATLKGCK